MISNEAFSKCRCILKELPKETLISQHILLFAKYARNSKANFKSNRLLKLALLTNFSLADHLRPIKILSPTGSWQDFVLRPFLAYLCISARRMQ